MREPNLGVTKCCSVCGRSFWCEDGVPICSSACDREYERAHTCECGNDKEHDQEFCNDCTCDDCGEQKEHGKELCESCLGGD